MAVDALLDRTYQAEKRHFWFRGFRRFVAPLLRDAVEGVPQPKLLDAGCGTGANLKFLEKYGRPFGLELYWRGLELGRSRGLTRLAQGSVTDLPYASESLDVVVSFDVLYCLHPPAERAALAEVFRVLRPGGAIIINVAALEMLRGDHSVLGGEVHRYRRPELRDKLQRAGFTVERLTYTNALLFPLTATVRAFQRLRGLKTGPDITGDFYVPPRPVNAMFAGTLALEASLIAAGIDMPFGSSLLCLGRKPRAQATDTSDR